MNDSALLNSYKCYDSIPTPSPTALDIEQQSKQFNDFMHQSLSVNSNGSSKIANNNQKNINLIRTASLDSLINSSEQDGSGSNKTDDSDDDVLSDSDSLCELKHISMSDGNKHISDELPRKSDIEELKNVEPPKEPVIKAYLEKCHKKCEVKNCCFKKTSTESENTKNNTSSCNSNTPNHQQPQQQQIVVLKSNLPARRNSIASSVCVSRMETIHEEPIEPKVSVKEILARFETLREAAETQSKASLKVTPNIAATTEKLEASLNQVNGHHDKSIEKNIVQNNHNLNDDEIIEKNEFIMMTAPSAATTTTVQQQQNGHHKLSLNNSSNSSGNNQTHEATVHQDESSQTSITKHSLLQFAMQHFRNDSSQEESPKSRSEKSQSADRRVHTADLVKWQSYPLPYPLLKLPPELTPLALECFECILRYCGDMAQDHEFTEVKCVYTVLMHCHKHLILRDEVYCQLMKQTTANRSTCSDSCQRAWRLLSILAAYFGCTESLKPYLVEHLTSAASDRRKSSHGTAQVCLTNLRKTTKYGGRKNVPSVEEVTAVSAGRSARRQIYRLPGGAERIVNTRCSTVVADVITELCALLGIESEAEQQEFSLYCIVQGDAFTMPLSFDDYILDVTTELLKSGQPFYLIFCRSVWHFPLKRDPAPTPLYIEVLFNQVAPDYLEGLLLEIPNIGAPTPDYVRDMARIAAILHRAADLNHIPVMKEIKFLLPKPALSLREIKPAQWVNLVQSIWGSVAPLSPLQCKAQFLSVLSAWPLFGSSFFAVKRVYGDDIMLPEESSAPMWRELILALNRRGVFFLDSNTHETLHHWHFIEIISTRKVRSEDGLLFLDMKVGNLLQQNVVRVQTEQAHEISRIMRQYITMAQSSQRDKRE